MGGVIGLGVDIVALGRIRSRLDRYGETFQRRIGSAEEVKNFILSSNLGNTGTVAVLFCLKEAFSKAMGCGFGRSLTPRDIRFDFFDGRIRAEILAQRLKDRLSDMNAGRIMAAFSISAGHAMAWVILHEK